MLDTLVYMFLDISFGTILWTSKKVIQGGSLVTTHIINKYYDMNKSEPLMIEDNPTPENTDQENNNPPTYNNTIQMISIDHLNIIKSQIDQQSKIIDELKTVLQNQTNINNK